MKTVCVSSAPLSGEVAAPLSKSYAHRMLIAAALSGGSVFFGPSDDARRTAEGLVSLGFQGTFKGETVSFGAFMPSDSEREICVGESGSTLRFLLPLATALGVKATFITEGRLGERPMEPLLASLRAHGVTAEGSRVCGKLASGEFQIDATVSSQFVTGLLMALPLLDGDSEIVLRGEMVSAPYVDITLDVLSRSGIEVKRTDRGFYLKGGQKYHAFSGGVPGDFSGAAFPLVAGALGKGVTVTGLDLTSVQGDKEVLSVLRAAGAKVQTDGARVTVKKGELKAFRADIGAIPDLAPVLAVLAAYAKGESRFDKVGRLRDKESDRLFAIREMLRAAGISTREEGDSLFVVGGAPKGGVFDSFSDHRMAMSEAVLAAFASGESTITDYTCVRKSYPEFWEDFAALGGKYEVER